MKAAERLAKIYAKYKKGDPISDQELATAITDLRYITDFLHLLGERFHFAWRDLYDCLRSLEDFREARKQR